MDLSLDRYEISKSLTISLDRMLIGNKKQLLDLYDLIMSNFDEETKKIKLIEEKINHFNTEQKFEYFIDQEKIFYLVFFKQIIFIKKLIEEINNYINSNINLVFIYSYLISKLYNEPNNISSNFILIINKMISDTTIMTKYDERLKNFVSSEILDKIFVMIKFIFSADTDFAQLLMDLENKKMNEYKSKNSVDYSDSYKELERYQKKTGGTGETIYDIEKNFEANRNYLFVQKRKIEIDKLSSDEYIDQIFKNKISIELWFGYNLFIYKRFEYNFEEYQTKINQKLESKQYDDIYKLNLNYLNDINTPDAGIIPIVGGNANTNKYIDYYTKYIKYKKKYLKLKKFEK
jgi:hypothetical protein